mgnify:CR=1 FL=1
MLLATVGVLGFTLRVHHKRLVGHHQPNLSRRIAPPVVVSPYTELTLKEEAELLG